MSDGKPALPRIYREPSRNIRHEGDLFLDAFIPRASDTPLTAPQTSITQEPTTCTKINLQWLPHILGVLEVLTQRDIWTGDDAEYFRIKQEIETLFNTLSGGLLCGDADNMRLRQSPTNKYLLEISYDNGLSWSTAFDYAKVCKTPTVTTIYENNQYIDNTQTIYDNDQTTYNNNVVNIAPNMIYGGLGNADRDKVICFALDLLLDNICASMAQLKIDEVNSQKSIGSLVGSVMNGLASVGGSALGLGITSIGGIVLSPWLVIGLALAGIGATIGTNIMSADLSLFENEEIRDDVKCVAYNYLKGQTPTRERFQASLDFEVLTGDAGTLKDLVRAYFQDLDVYIQFMKVCNELYNVASMLPVCPCDAVGWFHPFSFLSNNGGWTSKTDTLNRPYAQYNSGLGWGRYNQSITQSRLGIVTQPITTTITRAKVFFSRNYTLQSNGTCGLAVMTDRIYTAFAWATIFTAGQTITDIDYSGTPINLVNQRFHVGMGNSSTQNGTAFPLDLNIVGVHLYGNGVNPFI